MNIATKIGQTEKLMKQFNLSSEGGESCAKTRLANFPKPKKSLRERISVLYLDGTTSDVPIDFKPVWGVCFDGYGIYLRDARESTYAVAQINSSSYHLRNKICNCGDRYFWSKMGALTQEEVRELSDFIVRLGGEPLTGIYWSSVVSGHNPDTAWAFCVHPDEHCRQKGLTYDSWKQRPRKARPIVEL